MRIGIYPAAFDPVQKGHIEFALQAIAELQLDKVYLLPDPSPGHVQGVKALQHRVTMVQLALANQPNMGTLVLDTQDLDIRSVWPKIQARFLGQELYMLLSGAALSRIARWPRVGELGKVLPTFVVAETRGKKQDVAYALDALKTTKHMPFNYHVIETSTIVHRPSTFKRRLQDGRAVDLLPYAVYEYVMRNQLYHSK